MIEKTLTIPESILKAENMSYDNSNSGLNATDTQAAIDEINSKSNIKVFAESPMTNTRDGVVKFNEIGGVTEQFTTTGKQLVESIHIYDSTEMYNTVLCIQANLQPSTKYTLSFVGTAGNDYYSNENLSYQHIVIGNGITSMTFVTPDVLDKDNTSMWCENGWIILKNNVTTNTTHVFDEIMLNEGDVALPYEPYTGGIASPNPNYPQEIKKTVVTGVKTHGKNVCPISGHSGSTITWLNITLKAKNYMDVGITFESGSGLFSLAVVGIKNGVKTLLRNDSCGETVFIRNLSTQGYDEVNIQSYSNSIDNVLRDTFVYLHDETITEVPTYEPYQESVIEFSKPITLYGDPDAAVQDIFNTKQVERKYTEDVFDGSDDEGWGLDSACGRMYTWAYQGIAYASSTSKIANAKCSHYITRTANDTYAKIMGFAIDPTGSMTVYDSEFTTASEWKAHLSANPMKVVYELSEPIIEPLPEVDQVALTQLKTFEGVTYVEFISEIQPTFKAESSTTQEGSYVLDLLARTTSVEKQVEALDDTLLYAQEDILDIEEAFHIPETTDTVLDGSYPGLLKVNEIGGKMEQFSTSGAQLLDYDVWSTFSVTRGTGTYENNGITLTATTDDCYTGYTDADFENCIIPLTEGQSITISWEENTNAEGLVMMFANGTAPAAAMTNNASAKSLSYTATSGVTFITFRFGVKTNGTTISYKNIMINYGTEPLPYEPYTGGQASPNPNYPQEIKKTVVTGVKTHGKNFLKNTAVSTDSRFTVNDDGTVTINGTFSEDTALQFKSTLTPDVNGKFFNVIPLSGSYTGNVDHIAYDTAFAGGTNVPIGTAMKLHDPIDYSLFRIIIFSGAVCNNLVVGFMVATEEHVNTYEPYTESSYTFSEPIDLYGTNDVQDVITVGDVDRKYEKIVVDSEQTIVNSALYEKSFMVAYNIKLFDIGTYIGRTLNAMSTAFRLSNSMNYEPNTFRYATAGHADWSGYSRVMLYFPLEYNTTELVREYLAENPVEIIVEIPNITTKPLPIADQIGLNSLLTYNDVTYVEFDCDGPQPTFKGEYPTSKENSYVIQSLSDSLTVNGHSVESNVPANAKFTDTVYDDTALQAKVTSVENQIDGFLSLDSTVVVNTGKFKRSIDNRIETTVIPAGANLVASTYYDGKIYSTDGTRLYVSDLTTSTQYNITVQGQTVQITGIAVCCDTSDRICIHVVDSQGRASCVVYDNTIINGTQIDFATRMSDVAGIYQDNDKIYLLDNGYRLYTTDSSGMGYNNIGMVSGNPDQQTISWIKVFGDTLVVGKTDEMGSKACELYDLSTGNQIEIMISEAEAITLADVCYYEGGLIGVCTENGYFYRVECGKFYNPLAPINSEATPTFWREFSMDVDTSYGVTMYVEGDYLVIYDSQACYLFNSDGNNYYANVNTLVNVFSRDEGIYFVCQNDATVALYETKEISLAEAIMKIKA